LSDEHRAIIVLREIEDCDYDEIALILNVPVGTVRSRLHRARLQLRAKLRLVMEESSEYR
jgi:RNA polymerase sigma-70 factor (ECF subfamily)